MQSGSKRGRTGWSQDLSDSEASTELQGQGPFSLEEPAAPGRLASLPCPWSKYVSTPFQRPPRISQATSPDCWSYESRIVPQLLTFLSTLPLGCRHLLLVNCASVMPRCAQGTSAMRSAFLQQLLHTYLIGSAGKSVGGTGDEGSDPWVGKIPWKKWKPTPILLPGKSHGQRSLVGYMVHGVPKSWM